jgi:hypothetical protein
MFSKDRKSQSARFDPTIDQAFRFALLGKTLRMAGISRYRIYDQPMPKGE